MTTVAGRRVFAPDAPGVPVGDGGPASAARIDPWGRGLVATAAGGFVFADFSRIRVVGPGPPGRLDAAVTAVRGGDAHASVVRIRSTDAGTATVTVRSRRGRVVASASAAVPAGPGAFRLPPLPAGRYWIHLTVTAPGDRRTSARMAVLLGPAFPISAARHAAGYELSVDRATGVRARTCRRFSSRRVDCPGVAKRRCVQIDAVTRRGPFTFVRAYGCAGGFRRAPRWSFQAQPWPMLGSPPD